MNTEEFVLDRLSDPDKLYLKCETSKCEKITELPSEITMDFLALYRIDEITFEDKAPRKEALENVISSMSVEGYNFVYIIKGNKTGVGFYYGIARDFAFRGKKALEIGDIGEKILKPSLQGNFRGSVITKIEDDDRKKLIADINDFKNTWVLEGVPGINKDDEKFQAVDRVIDVMLGDEFVLMLIAKPILRADINTIQNGMYHLYDSIAPLGKSSVQESTGKSVGTSNSKTIGDSKTEGKSNSKAEQEGTGTSKSHTEGESRGKSKGTSYDKRGEKTSEGGSEGTSEDKNKSDTTSETTNKSTSVTSGDSESISKSSSSTESKQSGNNTASATTIEVANKKVQDWVKYMEDVVFPRLDYGLGRGLFLTTTVLLGKNPASLIKLENTLRSVYGGEAGNRMPLKAFDTTNDESSQLKLLQIPTLIFNEEKNDDERGIRTACSQLYTDNRKAMLGNWMSSQEISLMAGLPQKEVVGLALREEVEFGLNINTSMKVPLKLGHLVQSGVVLDGESGSTVIPVSFDKSYFDKHIFVTGVTGSGKTTTCQKLLLESGSNFMVIEPAKTEYRVMSEESFPDMLVFTLGKETGAPFRLNPFELIKGENITSRVDMIKASMEAAFDMEAAIPQLLETAIYECYEDKGWDLLTNKNNKYTDPFADGVFSFPTLGDLERKIEKVVKDQGFDDRLKDEYIGSIRARLKGLTVGSKGQMLNTPRSIDFVELIDKKVVLELEYIKSASEKSLIMGFILANLSEAIRVKYDSNEKKPIGHITLIEEAHRLLSKYTPGDSMNKKHGVEMFSDMLAEVRKYGESLIIADQIPNKLTPEILKNTNTKIVHKIFAQDDKEAIGNTMALKDEQKEHLSYLPSGRAIMIMPELSKAIQVQIKKEDDNNTERPPIEDDVLRNKTLGYYADVYKKGILPGLEQLDKKPSIELVRLYLERLQPTSQIVKGYYNCVHKRSIASAFVDELNSLKEAKCDFGTIVRIICNCCHRQDYLSSNGERIYQYAEELLKNIIKTGASYSVKEYKNLSVLDSTIM